MTKMRTRPKPRSMSLKRDKPDHSYAMIVANGSETKTLPASMPPRRASLHTGHHSFVILNYRRDHTDFSESTEEIAPLTEEEKKAKLDELRERLKAKKAAGSVKDKEEQKRNEVSTVQLIPVRRS